MYIEYIINFEDSMSEKKILNSPKYSVFSFKNFGSLKEVFNISTNNIIGVEAAKVL
jgi:hypothetical protein